MLRTSIHVALLVIAASTAAFPQTPKYKALPLGTLKGDETRVHAVNSLGSAVGGSGDVYGASRHAFLVRRGSSIIDLGVLPGGDLSEAFAINDAGQVVGNSNTSSSMRGFLWSSPTGMRALDPLPGANSSSAYTINNNGQIAGASDGRAVVWSNGEIRELPSLARSTWSEAHGVNASGEIVGFSKIADGPRAVLWSAGKIQNLGTLPGDMASRANFINDQGVVVGISEGSSGVRAFRWTSSQGMQPLGTLQGGDYSEAYGINNAGMIVGQSGSSLGTHAFLWTASTGMIDLNDIVSGPAKLVLTGAFAINDKGYIVAFGTMSSTTDKHKESKADLHIHQAGVKAYLLVPQ
jgi:probable HAF family extracellular repeat protein